MFSHWGILFVDNKNNNCLYHLHKVCEDYVILDISQKILFYKCVSYVKIFDTHINHRDFTDICKSVLSECKDKVLIDDCGQFCINIINNIKSVNDFYTDENTRSIIYIVNVLSNESKKIA